MTLRLATYITLFAGCLGADHGLTMAGAVPLGYCEIDDRCSQVIAHHSPAVKNYRDVRAMHWLVRRGYIREFPDFVWMSPPCFPAGTLILTAEGFKPIEGIRVGDVVLSHDGSWNPVEKVGRKMARTVEMKGQGCPSIRCTPEHPFYSASTVRRFPTYANGKRGNERHLGEPEWTAAKDMGGKRWAIVSDVQPLPLPPIPVPIKSKSPKPLTFDEGLAYIVGRWLGDGWVRSSRGIVTICCSKAEEETLSPLLGAQGLVWTRCENRTTIKFECSHRGLADWISAQFGSGAENKGLPGWVFGMPRHLREALFDGYCASDGWVRKDGSRHFTTVSQKLALSVRHLMETLGYSTSLHFVPVPAETIIEGCVVNQLPQWQVRGRRGIRTNALYGYGSSWYTVTSVEHTHSEEWVYDLQVGNSHSYVALGLSVHNCQDLSVAGKRAGLAGDRSGLFFDAIRFLRCLVGRGWRGLVLMEQVPGLLSSNGGRDFAAVLRAFRNLGAVDVGWRVLDSQWFGVAQRRRRLFFVIDLGGKRAESVLALAEGLRRHPAPRREAGEGVAASLTAGSHPGSNAPGRRREDDENLDIAPCLRAQGNSSHRADTEALVAFQCQGSNVGEMGTLRSGNGNASGGVPFLAHALTANGFDASEDGTGRGTPIVPVYGVDGDANGNPDLINAMKAKASGSVAGGVVAFPSYANHDELHAASVDVSPTLRTDDNPMVITAPMGVRRLSPRECERLQGFPDDWTRWGAIPANPTAKAIPIEDVPAYWEYLSPTHLDALVKERLLKRQKTPNGFTYLAARVRFPDGREAEELPDSARYRMCGNAVTSTVPEWLGRDMSDWFARPAKELARAA